MNNNYTISPEQAKSKYYLKSLANEILSGEEMTFDQLKSLRINHPDILKYKSKLLSGGRYGNSFSDWTTFLLNEYGRKKKCLSLGSGNGRIEAHLINIGFTDKFDTIELCDTENRRAHQFNQGIEAQKGDLNFARLPELSYDFILCHGILHHLINLEHVFDEINKALKPNGILLIYEYVGETRFQFSDKCFDMLQNNFKHIRFKRIPLWDDSLSGFEAIRSGELLALIDHYWGMTAEKQVYYGGVYFPYCRCAKKWNPDNDMSALLALDQTANMPPCYHMGVYRKSDVKPFKARQWTNEEMINRLYPPRPCWKKVKMIIKKSLIYKGLKTIIKGIN